MGFNFKSTLILLSIAFGCSVGSFSQTTFGTILGTVRDSSGAVVPNATVKLDNLNENTIRETTTNANGDYSLLNALPARYSVTIGANGFETSTVTDLTLEARQTLRVDANLQVGQMSQQVTVSGTAEGVVATDSQTIQASLDPLKMPVNVRAAGSTSPYNVIQVLPGVQSDNTGGFSIQGGIPSQTQYSLDGISVTDVTGNSPLSNAFPSTESIAEIRVQGVGNPAEYGQVGDITTISRSGTNDFHGGLFWYTQNAALNATGFGVNTKNRIVANDFGVTGGGPVWIPRLYNGKNRTFFFGTYEGFRFPKSSTVQNEVPTQAMRNGNFSAEGVMITNPAGQPYVNDSIPMNQISPIALKILSLYPLPNSGSTATVHSANYITNRDNAYHSNQYDIRIDQNFGQKQHIFGRWTSKNISALSSNDLLVPSNSNPDNYHLLTLAHNYSLSPGLYNEARFGFTRQDSGASNSYDGRAFSQSLGLQGLPGLPAFFNGLPEIDITNLTGLTADRLEGLTHGRTYQAVDNVSWLKGRHTFKFGFDYRHIEAVTPLGFVGGDNYGGFSFDGSFTGAPFADFLLGLPAQSQFDNVQQDNDGITNHYNAYAQDSFRVNEKLTLEYGLRWEFHPGYRDTSGNIGNFDPSVPKSGAVIYPDGYASLLATGFLQSANACPQLGSRTGPSLNGAPCMPVLSASQAGLPQSLRTAPNRFLPRFGFAYRPFGNKTVFRGGFSVYNTEVLGAIYYALTGTLQSATFSFNNSVVNGVPLFRWPNVKAGGSGISVPSAGSDYFGTANQINYKDPYSEQWNFSIDRDLGGNIGLRASYIGMATRDLVWAPNLNQSSYSTNYYVLQPLTSRPFPNWGIINTRANGANASYQAAQLEISRRFQSGLGFNSAYTFSKNLADNQGYVSSGFAGENAGARTMDALDLKHEYGPVYASRKHRWITSATYEMPVGKGRQYLANANRLTDALLGGWQINSILLWQSGPYLTPYFSGGDPSGTGSGIIGRNQAPDLVGNPTLSNPSANAWFNVAAYACPGGNCLIGTNPANTPPPIGRFGNAGVGTVFGPGTVNVDSGLSKQFAITERLRIKIEGSFTNIFNHTNLADPQLNITNPSAGVITGARSADFGGARTGQIGARLDF